MYIGPVCTFSCPPVRYDGLSKAYLFGNTTSTKVYLCKSVPSIRTLGNKYDLRRNKRSWEMVQAKLSSRFTTRWHEILTVS
ncbi:MAG: DUF4113 domain-containing protein [Ktedonobacteraceae bacterium]